MATLCNKKNCCYIASQFVLRFVTNCFIPSRCYIPCSISALPFLISQDIYTFTRMLHYKQVPFIYSPWTEQFLLQHRTPTYSSEPTIIPSILQHIILFLPHLSYLGHTLGQTLYFVQHQTKSPEKKKTIKFGYIWMNGLVKYYMMFSLLHVPKIPPPPPLQNK